jgi:hypothetical protein
MANKIRIDIECGLKVSSNLKKSFTHGDHQRGDQCRKVFKYPNKGSVEGIRQQIEETSLLHRSLFSALTNPNFS